MMRRLAVSVVGLLLAGACTAAPTPPPTPRPTADVTPAPDAPGWSSRAAAPFELTEVAGAAFGGEFWVAGGLDAERRASDRVGVYDPGTDRWREGPRLPHGVHHASLVGTPDALYLLGGFVFMPDQRPSDGVWRLDPGAAEWVAVASLPEPRGAGATAWDGVRVVYGGGVGPAGVSDTIWALRDGAWAFAGRLSRAREHLAATSGGDGRAWFLGGRAGGLQGNMATVDIAETTAARSIGELPTARGGVAAFWWPAGGACLVGGESPGGTNPQVECIDADGQVTELPGVQVARHGLAAAVIDDVAYVGLGGPQPGLFVSSTLEALPLGP
jgi:hypothetical protein